MKPVSKKGHILFLLCAVALIVIYLGYHDETTSLSPESYEQATVASDENYEPGFTGQASNIKIVYDLYSGGRVNTGPVMSIRGRLIEMRVSSERNEKFFFIDNMSIDSEQDSKDNRILASLEKHASSGAIARLDERGVISQIIGADFWQDLLLKTQAYNSENIVSKQWDYSEKTPYGRVNAKYEVVKSSEYSNKGSAFKKSYSFHPQPQLEVNLTCGGRWYKKNPHIASLDCKERLVFYDAKKKSSIFNEITMTIQSVSALAASDYTRIDSIKSYASSYKGKPRKYNALKKRLVGKTLDDVFALIDQIADDERDAEAYLDLKAWVSLYPDRLESFYARLEGLDKDDPKFRLGVRALMGDGSRKAQQILARILRDSGIFL
jgi:hypothetical protein